MLAAILLDVGEDYASAFGGALAGAAEADALRGAGDEDDFVLQAIGHWAVDSRQFKVNSKGKRGQEFNTEGTESKSGTEKVKEREKDNAETRRALRFAEIVDARLERVREKNGWKLCG